MASLLRSRLLVRPAETSGYHILGMVRSKQTSTDGSVVQQTKANMKIVTESSSKHSGSERNQMKVESNDPKELIKFEMPSEDISPKKHVFQEFRQLQNLRDPIYTIQQASDYAPMQNILLYYRYNKLTLEQSDADYAVRGINNEDSVIHHFPEVTDFVVVGSGLVGSATAYYLKKASSRCFDVILLDKEPYSPHNCTAICNGLITTQSKSQDISRIASLSKELIRNLKNDQVVTDEDFAKINYRPCTHLILWPESEVSDVMKSIELQMEDGCYTEAKLPNELEATFPWLKAVGTDIALGTHGCQDEALVDPIALRNLYRTLAQAYGTNCIKAEVIDFNTMHWIHADEVTPLAAGAIVARVPHTGELRNLNFAKALLSLGHNTPYLEARSEMESYHRDAISDLHFLQPKLRVCYSFHSLGTPIINFPVITDIDGSVLVREDFYGDFKYYLTSEESERFLDGNHDLFLDLSKDDPYQNRYHKGQMFIDYFYNVIKPRLVSRIAMMEDAEFNIAISGFESQNTHDGSPIISPHPFHFKILLSGGYGSRMMNFGPAAAAALSDLIMGEEEESFDMTRFYWDRVIKGRRVEEFKSLLNE